MIVDPQNLKAIQGPDAKPSPRREELPPGVQPLFHRDRDGQYFFDGLYQVGNTWINQLEYEKYYLGSA